ncbi:MAG TPA: WG repeat-containing protein [Sedimentisphaerales bacterium]|nr:WG repeat-containing protein [Sedimentisphaerales bacterium]
MWGQANKQQGTRPAASNGTVIEAFTCLVLVLSGICVATKDSNEKLPSLAERRERLSYKPSYFREYEYYREWERGFQEGLGQVEVEGKWGFIDSAGKIVIDPNFDEVCGFREGVCVVRMGAAVKERLQKAALFGLVGHWRYIDGTGRFVISELAGGYFSEGISPVVIGGNLKQVPSEGTITKEAFKYGSIDKKGRMVIPAKYGWLDYFSEGLALFSMSETVDPNAKYGYLNPRGEVAIEAVYEAALPFSEGLALVWLSGKPSFIDRAGTTVMSLPYESARSFSEGLGPVRQNGKWGYINKGGRLVIPCKFPLVELFSEGCAAVIVDGKIGYIDTNGEFIIKPKFPYFSTWETPVGRRGATFFLHFSEGLVPVMIKDLKWGYVDKKGDFAIEPKFDLAGQFTEGFAKVAIGDKLGYIDKQGRYIWEPTR